MIGLDEGGGSLHGDFNLFGEVHCFLPFPISLVSLNSELPLGEGCILDNETAGEWSFDVAGTSANFLPRALYSCDFLMPLPKPELFTVY